MSFSLCGSVGANTGVIKCDERRGIPKKILIGGAVFTSSNYASTSAFDTAMLAKLKLASGNAQKLFPSPEITGTSDKTEANKESTLGNYGPKVVLIEGRPSYEFDVIAGCQLEKQLRKYNGAQVPVFIIDDSSTIWGKLDGSANFVGVDVLIFVTPHRFGDGSNGQTTKISLSFVSASDFSDAAAFINTNQALNNLVGQVSFTLTEYAAHASNVHKIAAKASSGQPGADINLADYFTTELAVAGAWTAFTGPTFSTALAITSVAYNSGNKGWDITFDSTAYTALAGGASIKINLADPATIGALNVVETEGIAVVAVK